jgi:hypothetical protein
MSLVIGQHTPPPSAVVAPPSLETASGPASPVAEDESEDVEEQAERLRAKAMEMEARIIMEKRVADCMPCAEPRHSPWLHVPVAHLERRGCRAGDWLRAFAGPADHHLRGNEFMQIGRLGDNARASSSSY